MPRLGEGVLPIHRVLIAGLQWWDLARGLGELLERDAVKLGVLVCVALLHGDGGRRRNQRGDQHGAHHRWSR